MYKYLKKMIHNLWYNYLADRRLTRNLSSCVVIHATVRQNRPGLCPVVASCLWSSWSVFSLPCSLARCLNRRPEQPVSQVRWQVPCVLLQQLTSTKKDHLETDVPTLRLLISSQTLTLMIHGSPWFEAALVDLQNRKAISHKEPAKNPWRFNLIK